MSRQDLIHRLSLEGLSLDNSSLAGKATSSARIVAPAAMSWLRQEVYWTKVPGPHTQGARGATACTSLHQDRAFIGELGATRAASGIDDLHGRQLAARFDEGEARNTCRLHAHSDPSASDMALRRELIGMHDHNAIEVDSVIACSLDLGATHLRVDVCAGNACLSRLVRRGVSRQLYPLNSFPAATAAISCLEPAFNDARRTQMHRISDIHSRSGQRRSGRSARTVVPNVDLHPAVAVDAQGCAIDARDGEVEASRA